MTSALALTSAAQAQQVLVNQSSVGANSLTSGNTATLINSSGFGAVTLQSFQDAANAVNTTPAPVVYGSNFIPGSVTQTIATGGSIDVTTTNINAGFSTNGAQLVLGSQSIGTNVNAAGLTLGNGAIVTVKQNNVGAITADQKNTLSAGYNQPSGGTFGIGQGPAAIQGQSIGAGGVVNNTGFQNNGFNLNTASIGVAGASATVGFAQKPGAITSTQTNFADAGQASPTFIDPSITALNQTVTANVNQINSIGAAAGSTLILDGTGSSGVQSIGTSALDSFTVRNAARALTWGATSSSTGANSYSPLNSDGTGDVSISDSNQTIGLNFNSIVAGTAGTPQNVNFGGSSAGLFEQTATYGSTSSTASGVTIATQPTGGYANFGVEQFVFNPVNGSFASTGYGAAVVTDVAQTASASLNSALVTGAVNGNLAQSASLNTETGNNASGAVGNGPQLSNLAGAVVSQAGPASLMNVDQTSNLASNSLKAGSIGPDGLNLSQTGYQTKSPNPSGLSSNAELALASGSGNSSISDSQQTLLNSQNTFTALSSASGTFNSPSQLNITQSLNPATIGSALQEQAAGGDNSALSASFNISSLSNSSQLGSVNLNSVKVGSTGANTQAVISQTSGGTGTEPLNVTGSNQGVVFGRSASITDYGQRYDVALNSVSLDGAGAKNVTQASGGTNISTQNTLDASATALSPFASAIIGGTLGSSQKLTASANTANLGGIGSLIQTAGPLTSDLANSATAISGSSAASNITGLVQTTSQSVNTGL